MTDPICRAGSSRSERHNLITAVQNASLLLGHVLTPTSACCNWNKRGSSLVCPFATYQCGRRHGWDFLNHTISIPSNGRQLCPCASAFNDIVLMWCHLHGPCKPLGWNWLHLLCVFFVCRELPVTCLPWAAFISLVHQLNCLQRWQEPHQPGCWSTFL